MRAILSAFILLTIASAVACGTDEESSEPTPWNTPDPKAVPDFTRPPESDVLIPLDEPIPYPIPFTIGTRSVMLPTGSTVEDVTSDPGGSFVTVARGESSATFNGETGEVIEWDVLPEDAADFEPLRE